MPIHQQVASRPSSWVNDPYPTGRATGRVLAFCEISKCVNASPEGIREVLKCPLGAEKFSKFKLTQTLRQPIKLRMSLYYAEIPLVTDNCINLVQFNLSYVFRVTWYHFSIVPTGNEVLKKCPVVHPLSMKRGERLSSGDL